MTKASSNTSVTNGNSNYNIAGAKYTLYTNSSCTTIAKSTYDNDVIFTIHDDGGAVEYNIAAGTYYLKETKAATGYTLDSTVYTVTVPGAAIYTKAVKDAPQQGKIKIVKKDANTGETVPLAGFKFTIYKAGTNTAVATNLTTDDTGSVTSSALPLGNYEILETAVQGSYKLNSSRVAASVTSSNTITVTVSDEMDVVSATVNKEWLDNNNVGGTRPSQVNVILIRSSATTSTTYAKTAVLKESNNWTVTYNDLPKYDDSGNLYTYTWQEVVPNGYTETYSTSGTVTTITNSNVATTSATVKKVWNDNDNADGIRPTSLTVKLMNGNTVVDTVTLNSGNNWQATVNDLPKYASATSTTPINYTWSEQNLPSGYTLKSTSTSGTITTLTNEHTPTVSATVKKVWNDNNNADGIRLANLTVKLMNGTTEAGSVTLNAGNSWQATINNLPKYASATSTTPITYTWSEQGLPDGYTLKSQETVGTITTITNEHSTTTSATVKKVWNDNNNADGIRPTSLTVKLMNGNTQVDSVTLNAGNNWQATINNLPKYASATSTTPINYTWSEQNLPSGYTLKSTSTSGIITTLTNEHNPTTSATVKKVWNDNNNADNIRPTSLTVNLMNGNTQVDSVTLNAGNNWQATINNLPKYASATSTTPINYTWSEQNLPSGYTLENQTLSGTITTITNVHSSETSATVKKVWNDNNNADGIRPTSLTVNLMNGNTQVDSVTLNASNGWQATVSGLPKFATGSTTPIDYTWSEQNLPSGYTLKSSNQVGTVTTLTNEHNPTVSATVKKVWSDNNNADNIRPTSLTVNLMNGNTQVDSVTLNAENNWQATINDLPKYANSSSTTPINYTWSEQGLPDGYTLKSQETVGTITTITNEHGSTTSATVKKVWSDNDNADGIRPANLTVKLMNGTTEVNSVTLNAGNSWQATINNLPKYANASSTTPINYTWSEQGLPDGYTLKSQNTVGTITTLTNEHGSTTSATVKKVWSDNDNADGIRPTSLTVKLMNGTTEVDTVTLNAGNNWQATINDLPKYANASSTTPINYTWSEQGLPSGYTLKSQNTVGTITTLTNEHGSTTSATVKKVWNDNDNADGIRPTSLTVKLMNGTTVVDTVTLNAGNNWQATVNNLPKYASTTSTDPINYTWLEQGLPDGYTLKSQNTVGTVTTITNEHGSTTSATVKKVWSDNNNADGIRPTSLTVKLMNGTTVVDTVLLNTDNSWQITINDLPKYANSSSTTPINYTWSEQGLPDGYTLKSQETVGTITTITNEHGSTTSATVKKVWNDADNQDGLRPANLTVKLMNGTTEVDSVTLNAGNNWQATVNDLPKYQNGTDTPIEYTWAEDDMPAGYTFQGESKNGTITTLTNQHAPSQISIAVKKAWDDDNNNDGKRPSNVSIILKKNGSDYRTINLSADNNWQVTVSDLPEKDNGETITWTWEERDMPAGYSLDNQNTSNALTTITNKHPKIKRSLSVKKVWNDNDDKYGIRPENLEVTLKKNNVAIQVVTLNAGNNWQATVNDLDAYEDGVSATYTWEETNVPAGYQLTGSSTNGDITTLTNTADAPSIGTKLATADGASDIIATTGTITLTDTVTYTNLVPGIEYELRGELRTKDGSESGTTIPGSASTKKFTPSTKDGVVTIELSLNVSGLGTDVVAFEELYIGSTLIAEHKDINDEDQTVDAHNPSIGTTLATIEGEKDIITSGTGIVRLKDVVVYSDLIPNRQYTLQGTIHGRNGSSDLGSIGDAVTKDFTPTSASGTVELEFTINLDDITTQAIVAFERLYYDQELIASHEVITDENQTVTGHVPTIGTRLAIVNGDADRDFILSETGYLTLVDQVTYADLVPGHEYELHAALHTKKADGSDAGEVEGTATTQTFTPETPAGTVDVALTVDLSRVPGSDLVAFEELYLDGRLIADHKDITDENQTVISHVPEIGTKLATVSGEKDVIVGIDTETVTLVDTVEYHDLTVGHEYELHATMHAKAADGSDAGEIEGIAATQTFTPETSDGTVNVELTVSLANLRGTEIVAFEELYLDERLIAEHKDITDTDQTVDVHNPSIGTKLATVDGGKAALIGSDTKTVTLVDTVEYHDLVPGTDYIMRGVLHTKGDDGSDAGEIAGSTGETQFKPEKPDGTIEVRLTADASKLTGNATVAFEELLIDQELLASHKDIADEEQTVSLHRPSIGTTLMTTDGKKDLTAVRNRQIPLMDTVEYHDLVPGKEYEMRGEIHGRDADGKDAGVLSGSKVAVKFTPTEADGKVGVRMSVSVSDLGKKTFVAFEELHVVTTDEQGNTTDTKLAEHKEIDDSNQSITAMIRESDLASDLMQTGDTPIAMAAMAAVGTAGYAVAKSRRRKA